jgi:O-antigen/teichoic acid export membrane protein
MPTAFWIYQFSTASLVLLIMQIPYSAAIMAHERMDYFAYVSIIEVLLKLAFALWLPYVKSDKLFVYGCYSLGVGILNFLLYFVYSKYHFKSIKIQNLFHRDLFREMLSFSGWNIFGTFAYMIKNQGLNVLLNAFFGPVVNAARGVSAMVSMAIQGFQSNIVIAFKPQTVQSYAEGNISRVRNLMYSLSKISYLMLFMLSMPIIIELPYILHLWLGETVPDYAISFTMLILINMIFSSLNTPITQVVHATGKVKWYQISSVVICAILPISWIILEAGGNPNSVYVVSLCVTCINHVICMIILKKIFPYSIREYLINVIFPCLGVSLLATLLPIALHYTIA